MAVIYAITDTSGELKFSIQQNTYDGSDGFQNHTDLKLTGYAYKNWGEHHDNNFYRLLENFACPEKISLPGVPQDYTDISLANPTAPTGSGINNPVPGQLWFNTSTKKLYVNDGINWEQLASNQSVVDLDFVVDPLLTVVADFTAEFNNLVTTPTGGNTSLNPLSDTQVRDAIITMINRRVTQTPITVFTPNIGNATITVHSTSVTRAGTSSDTTYTQPAQTVILTGAPSNTTHALIRCHQNTNSGGNRSLFVDIRKNASEAWAQKIYIDPTGDDTTPSAYEGEYQATFVVELDTTNNSFQYQTRFNTFNLVTGETAVWTTEFYLEGFYVTKYL